MADMKSRFRGFLPVVIDIETGGLDPTVHSILEIAVVKLRLEGETLQPAQGHDWSVVPHPATRMEEASLKITGIDPDDPERKAISEQRALQELFRLVHQEMREQDCQCAILTGHNAHFDLGFIEHGIKRNNVKDNPFHPFSVFDTVALGGLAFGHTVLGELCARAGIAYDADQAHSALYDARITAELFCHIVNRFPMGMFNADPSDPESDSANPGRRQPPP